MKRRLIKYLVCMILFCSAYVSYGQQLRSVPDSVAREMKNQKDFQYANDPAFWQKEKPDNDPALLQMLNAAFNSTIFKWLLYLIIAAAAIYVIYQVMIVNNFFIFSRAGKKGKTESGEEEEKIPEDINEKIRSSIAAGEYRLAIRFLYIQTLGVLRTANKIKWHAKATNNDYLRQMKAYPNASDFRRLTGIYEYVWYGEFQPDAMQFETISAYFNHFNENI